MTPRRRKESRLSRSPVGPHRPRTLNPREPDLSDLAETATGGVVHHLACGQTEVAERLQAFAAACWVAVDDPAARPRAVIEAEGALDALRLVVGAQAARAFLREALPRLGRPGATHRERAARTSRSDLPPALAESLGAGDGLTSMAAGDLRAVAGCDATALEAWLTERGLRAHPEPVPAEDDAMVRLWSTDAAAADVVAAVLEPGPMQDEIIREIVRCRSERRS